MVYNITCLFNADRKEFSGSAEVTDPLEALRLLRKPVRLLSDEDRQGLAAAMLEEGAMLEEVANVGYLNLGFVELRAQRYTLRFSGYGGSFLSPDAKVVALKLGLPVEHIVTHLHEDEWVR